MTDILVLLKGRLATVRADLDNVISRAEGVDLDWAPAVGVRSFGNQLLEIIVTEKEILAIAKGSKPSEFAQLQEQCHRATLGDYLALLEVTRETTLDYLNTLSPLQLEAEVVVPTGWWEGLGQASVPVAELFRSLAAHEWYHTGQLTTYLWILGKSPYA